MSTTVKTSVTLTGPQYADVLAEAEKEEISISAVIGRIIERWRDSRRASALERKDTKNDGRS